MVLRLSSWSNNYRSYGQSRRILCKIFVYNRLRTIRHPPFPDGSARPNPPCYWSSGFSGSLGRAVSMRFLGSIWSRIAAL
jgi:hypothetical protein